MADESPDKSKPVAPELGTDAEPSPAFLSYPVSTLSPRIVPNDLTSFKTRGISQVEKQTAQKLAELRRQYVALVDEFNWNKLVYEAKFGFEPVVGETYHLYRDGDGLMLSMIGPGQWHMPFVGTFTLGANGRWELVEAAPDFDLAAFLDGLDESAGDTPL